MHPANSTPATMVVSSEDGFLYYEGPLSGLGLYDSIVLKTSDCLTSAIAAGCAAVALGGLMLALGKQCRK